MAAQPLPLEMRIKCTPADERSRRRKASFAIATAVDTIGLAMLVQWTKRDIPDLDIHVRRLLVRHQTFAFSILRSNGIAHDWELQSRMVAYREYDFTRTQIAVLVDGRGYLWLETGPRTLSPGDVFETDQRRVEFESYAGSPLLLMAIEYDDDGLFGRAHRGAARHSRIGPHDAAVLRSLADRMEELEPAVLVREFVAFLRAIGQRVALDFDPWIRQRTDVARVFGAMGDAISRIDRQPSLAEIAEAAELSERQTHRHLKTLMRDYAYPNDSWRHYISDARIGAAMQMLSVSGLPLARVAKLAGYGSATALCHVFALKGAPTPREIARRLAERWG